MTLNHYRQGRHLVWDFTCNDTFADSYLSNTSKVAGKAADEGEKKKYAKYEHIAEEHHFVPIAIETMGVWGTSGLKLVREIGAKISEITGDNRSTSHLLQSISMAIQRGNAISVLGTHADDEENSEYFNL